MTKIPIVVTVQLITTITHGGIVAVGREIILRVEDIKIDHTGFHPHQVIHIRTGRFI
jgi:hypothetical protein